MCDFYSYNKPLFDKLDNLIKLIKPEENSLIQILHYAQDIFGYIPKEVQNYISDKLNIKPSEVYDVINFYSYFSTEPKGKYKINVCPMLNTLFDFRIFAETNAGDREFVV